MSERPTARTEPARPPRAWRRYALIAAAALAVVAGRVLHDSWSALTAGEDAERRGDRTEAVRSYLQAVRMYVPGSPFVARALDRLTAMAGAAESRSDEVAARHALEAIRAGLLGARSFYTPHARRLPAVEERLALLYARAEAAEAGGRRESQATRIAWHRAKLAARPGPATAPALIAVLGLAVWLGAAVTFLRKGVDRALRLRTPWAVASGVGFLVGFLMFVVGLRLV